MQQTLGVRRGERRAGVVRANGAAVGAAPVVWRKGGWSVGVVRAKKGAVSW
jgi:hypothetical protein